MIDFGFRHIHTRRDGDARRDRKRGEASIYDGANGPREYFYRVSPCEKREFKSWAEGVFNCRLIGSWPEYMVGRAR